MRSVTVGNIRLQLEAAEAGGRYLAPILIFPGLFQSPVCWRGMTSMLAHRGWNVYLLPRAEIDDRGAAHIDDEYGWQRAVDAAATAAARVGDQVIVLGADIGATLALSILDRVRPLALGLFAPADPAHVGDALERNRGFLARRLARKAGGPVTPPASIARTIHRETDSIGEPRMLVADLTASGDSQRPTDHPPAIVFAVGEDPLVAHEHALSFTTSPYSKPARTVLQGRFWPSSGWEPVADDVHRFLILTLADRVVEFPDEIINE